MVGCKVVFGWERESLRPGRRISLPFCAEGGFPLGYPVPAWGIQAVCQPGWCGWGFSDLMEDHKPW